jgi:hypothetical protein
MDRTNSDVAHYHLLRQFCATEHQRKTLDRVIEFGSATAAARETGVSRQSIDKLILKLKERRAKLARLDALAPRTTEGFVPKQVSTAYDAEGEPTGSWVQEVPEPQFETGGEDEGDARDGGGAYLIKGVSTLFGPDGEQRAQWVKTSLSQALFQRQVTEAAKAFFEPISFPRLADPMPAANTDIIPWINIGDGHLWMLAHEAQTGATFDLDIAERELCAAIDILIDDLPEARYERLVINDLGDMTHAENVKAETEHSGHRLDVDGPMPNMIRVYSKVMRYIVDKALTKADTVDVIVNQGNHSRSNDFWMVELLNVAYSASGRVNVLNNDSVFIGYRMGNTLVMCHHSDKTRPERLVGVMISDFREDFGETEYHYIDIGHIHHKMASKEHPEIVIESWNNLAPRDRWAAEGGYRSKQSITVVMRSRTYGEVGRHVLPIRRVRDVIAAAMTRDGKTNYQPATRRAFLA